MVKGRSRPRLLPLRATDNSFKSVAVSPAGPNDATPSKWPATMLTDIEIEISYNSGKQAGMCLC